MRLVEVCQQRECISDQSKCGVIYYELFKLNRDTVGDIQKCMNYLNHANDCAPAHEWTYLFELSLFIKQAFRLKQDAYGIMKRVLEKDPPHAKVWYEAACLAEDLCEYDVAQDYLKKSLSLEPVNTIIFLKIAEILCSLKRYQESIACLQEAIGICQ